MNYIENYKRNVKKEGIVDQKGRYDYISWAHAEKIGNELDPDFDWNTSFEFLDLGLVEIEMKFKGKTRKHKYPILNHQNKPIANPTSFDLNNAQMRGFAKLFSMMTGIGLSLFTGEDLRYLDNEDEAPNKQQKASGDKTPAKQQNNVKNGKQAPVNDELKEARKSLVDLVTVYCKETGNNPTDVYKTYKITKASGVEDFEEATKKIKVLRAEFYAQPENKLGE